MTSSADAVAWWPESMPPSAGTSAEARDRWAYVTIEEVVGFVAELVRWPWPLADQLGGLYWPEGDEDEMEVAVVPVPALRRLMYEPSGLVRAPRCGDVFAAETRGSNWAGAGSFDQPDTMLKQLFPGLVLDVSADAREAAKLAYHAAHAAVYDGSHVGKLLERSRHERQHTAPTITVAPADTGVTVGPE